jgi:membrane protease YdiL (CAAX protease family)
MMAVSVNEYPLKGDVGRPARKVQGIEVSVFLFLIVPSLATSFLISDHVHMRFMTVAILSIINDMALVALVGYFVWRNGEPLEDLGWTRKNLQREIILGLVLFLPIYFFANLLASVLHLAGLSAPAKPPSFLLAAGLSRMALAFLLTTVVAIAEETIFRGYLILRIQAVTGRAAAAVLLSSFIFSLGHGYEGMAGVISVFTLGIIFAVVYLWRHSLVAPAVVHFLIDFTAILVVPKL